jgi:antitoxin (DNA-binding transcriptional repressor) of toxin-antitoxin stability system
MPALSASTLPPAILESLSRGERVVVVRDGEHVAAIIPAEDLALLERLIEEAEDRIDVEEAQRRLDDPDDEIIPYEQARRDLDLE